MDINIGKILKNRYEILNKLTTGGSSKIYIGNDTRLNRKVIIKILLEEIFSTKKKQNLFLNEIQITSRLQHKNIVKLLDFFIHETKLCLILEYYPGPTLNNFIKKNKQLTEKNIVIIFIQILQALEFAFKKNIIHRDIKPANILILNKNKIKILDFGISIDRSYLTENLKIKLIGSAQYVAPEFIANQTVTGQTDIYSVGIMLYETLLGQPPFSSDNALLLMKKHLYEKIIRVREYDRKITQLMENIIVKATAKNPEERYLNAENMIADLEKIINSEETPKPKFLKNEIYRGEISNLFLIDEKFNVKNIFWLKKHFFFLIFFSVIFLFVIFLILTAFISLSI